MLEILVQPYRLPNHDLVNQFYALLSTYPHLQWIGVTLEIADLAAQLRADHALKTPDAVQAATAIVSQATGLISNDKTFRKVPGLEVFILDEAAIKRSGRK
jgi:predicted nucleic acid-binding protein